MTGLLHQAEVKTNKIWAESFVTVIITRSLSYDLLALFTFG